MILSIMIIYIQYYAPVAASVINIVGWIMFLSGFGIVYDQLRRQESTRNDTIRSVSSRVYTCTVILYSTHLKSMTMDEYVYVESCKALNFRINTCKHTSSLVRFTIIPKEKNVTYYTCDCLALRFEPKNFILHYNIMYHMYTLSQQCTIYNMYFASATAWQCDKVHGVSPYLTAAINHYS